MTKIQEQKKEIEELFVKEYHNSDLMVRLKRLLIYSLISIILAILILIQTFIYEEEHLSSILIAIILLLTALFFFYGRYTIKQNILNKLALKKIKRS